MKNIFFFIVLPYTRSRYIFFAFVVALDQIVYQKTKALLPESEYKRFFQAAKTLESKKVSLKRIFSMLRSIVELFPDFDLIMATLFSFCNEKQNAIQDRYLNENQKTLLGKLCNIADPYLLLPEGRQDLVHMLFEAFIQESRVLYFFLAMVKADSRALHNFSAQKKIEHAEILFSVGAPLAYRLGLHDLKESFESLAFSLLFPKEYQSINAQRDEYVQSEHIFLRRVVGKIRYFLKKYSISFTIKSRVKNVYSIYRKLKKKGRMDVKTLNDIFAVRIIVPEVLQCYLTLGLLHQHFPYLPGKIKDYISKPKPNAYQSLHTTLEVPFDTEILPVEVQIRTEDMNIVATSGVAAHVLYKKQKYGNDIESKKAMKKKMAELLSYLSEKTFLKAAEDDVFSQHIFVFSKDQKIFSLIKGATVLDFAYTIHTDVGNKAESAVVNGKEVGIDAKLHNGDQVEVKTSPFLRRQENWLRIARMPSVKKTIRSYYHKES